MCFFCHLICCCFVVKIVGLVFYPESSIIYKEKQRFLVLERLEVETKEESCTVFLDFSASDS